MKGSISPDSFGGSCLWHSWKSFLPANHNKVLSSLHCISITASQCFHMIMFSRLIYSDLVIWKSLFFSITYSIFMVRFSYNSCLFVVWNIQGLQITARLRRAWWDSKVGDWWSRCHCKILHCILIFENLIASEILWNKNYAVVKSPE